MTFRVAALALALLAGCLAPAAEDLPSASTDVVEVPDLPTAITGLAHVARVEFGGGNDLVHRPGFVYVSASSGTHVVDVSVPDAPVLLASLPCIGKDIGVVDLPDGRRIVTVSSQSDDGCPGAAKSGGIRLIDVTDAAEPVVLAQVPLRYGSHTHTPYGDTGLVYNSAYDLANPLAHHRSEIVDVRDPTNPGVAGEFLFPATSLSHGCHDVLAEPERDRAICAGITETMIWDTADAMAPKVVATIRNPLLNIHHSAATARDGELLVLGDEWAGALVNGCHGPAPTGALWFYDISDPTAPKELGHLPPPKGRAPPAMCTAHNFNVIEGTDLLVSAFYSGGTALVDFSDPAKPKVVEQVTFDDGVAWASYHFDGRVYVGDLGRGLDVLTLE